MFEFVDRWIDRWEGKRTNALSKSESVKMIQAGLRAALAAHPEIREVLLTGDEDLAALEALGREIALSGVSITCGEDVCHSAGTMDKLAQCQGVVLVHQKGKTTCTDVEQEIEKIKEDGKEILGYIMV